jgi:transposase
MQMLKHEYVPREAYDWLAQENRTLRKEMRRMQREYEAKIEAFELRVEQLSRMVFGPPRRERRSVPPAASAEAGPRERRPAHSYRRPVPCEAEVTGRRTFTLPGCPACGGRLTDRTTVIRFVEDMPLPLTGRPLKTVERRTIQCGYCETCRRRVSAVPYGPQACELGPNVKMYVSYAVTILGQTWGKVQVFLKDVYGIRVSDGEIAAILQAQHRALLPALARISERIRDGPAAHYDETTWPVQEEHEGRQGWVKTSSTAPDTLFLLGRSRGRGNAEELRGEDTAQPAVTDDFGSYKNVFRKHGLCWAHVLRKARDLAESDSLSMRKRRCCKAFSERLQALYGEVAAVHGHPFVPQERRRKAEEFSRRITALCAPDALDPRPLASIKETLLRRVPEYLLCVREPNVPMTNNKAERALRPLVIKRKLSFGSKTHRGAQAMETLLSVLFTLWWSRPENFFAEYKKLLRTA